MGGGNSTTRSAGRRPSAAVWQARVVSTTRRSTWRLTGGWRSVRRVSGRERVVGVALLHLPPPRSNLLAFVWILGLRALWCLRAVEPDWCDYIIYDPAMCI